MNFHRRSIVLVMLLFAGSWGALPTFAQQRPALPSQQHASTVQASSAVAMETLPAVDVAALRSEDRARSDRIGPYRYGKTVDAGFTPDRHGTWEQLPSGTWLWRLRIRSRDAVSLSVGFTRFQLPPGAALYLHGPGETAVHGPYTAADATAGQHWTPLVRSEQLTLELEVPPDRRSAVGLVIGKIVHGYRALPSRQNDAPRKSGSCNLDVACEEADPWRQQVRSVGRYTYESDGETYLCSGALINNTAEDKTPYFMTAEHCISTPAQAATMVFYWNYQNRTCRSLGSPENGTVTDDDPGEQTSSGAELRARSGNYHQSSQITGKPDLALVEIDDAIPDSYDLYVSGWSRAGTATAKATTIHHPAGYGKRISFDEDPSTVTGFGSSSQGNTHFRIGNWELGTTEAGSSGGPLLNTEQRIVGVLSGGFAGCGDGSPSEDNDKPDWYGRLAPGFESGDYNGTTLADVLDPENTGTETLGGQPLSDGVDATPPAPIQDLRISRVNTQEQTVTLQWTATGDDGQTGTALRYDLRFDTTRIETAMDFEQATAVKAPSDPPKAGHSLQTVVNESDGLRPDRSYYFAVVAEDDAGNRSPMTTGERKAVLVKDIEIEKGGVAAGASRSASETRFVLNETQQLRVALYDLLGRRVRVLLDEEVREGFERTVRFDASSLSSGPYFLRFTGERFAVTRKIVVVN
jgi:lysyl endopeptidase